MIEYENEKKDDIIDIALSEAIKMLVESLVKDTTNYSKSEVKALSILNQNKFIKRIIKDYPQYKKQLNNNFEKSLQQAIEKFSYAIANKGMEKEIDSHKFLNLFRKR